MINTILNLRFQVEKKRTAGLSVVCSKFPNATKKIPWCTMCRFLIFKLPGQILVLCQTKLLSENFQLKNQYLEANQTNSKTSTNPFKSQNHPFLMPPKLSLMIMSCTWYHRLVKTQGSPVCLHLQRDHTVAMATPPRRGSHQNGFYVTAILEPTDSSAVKLMDMQTCRYTH